MTILYLASQLHHASQPNPGSLCARYHGVRQRTEQLARGLSAEDQCVQSMPEASPVKWHLAHTTWFFETFVILGLMEGERCSPPSFSVLFNSYYESVGERFERPSRGMLTRPGVEEVAQYRRRVDTAMERILGGPLSPDLVALVELGLHHEQQHHELLATDLLHLFSLNPMEPVAGLDLRPSAGSAAAQEAWQPHHGQRVAIGYQASEAQPFAYDNEGPRHQALLSPHEISSHLVTNGEYLAFMEDGGYERHDLWMSLGWEQVKRWGWRAPAYWRLEGKGWARFTLMGRQGLLLEAPVSHVSWFEADAYARWAGARLPTEFEWEASAPAPGPAQGDHFGQVWQWTASPYTPYPGFVAPAGAVGEYNGKFMCNQYVLRGSSVATAPGHARRSYRNFFPPSARWQFTGLRLARDL